MAKNLYDAIYGCLIAGAIGDALGAPVEGWYYTDIRKKYGRIHDIIASPKGNTGPIYGGSDGDSYDKHYDGPAPKVGWFTDDTTMRHYLCLAILEKNGRVTPDDYAAVLIEKMNPNRVWMNERALLWKLKAGMNPWESGRGMIPAGTSTMAIAPIGIVNAGNPAQAYQDALNISYICQEGHNRDGAATFAAGLAAAFLPEATIEKVLETMFRHATDFMRRGMTLTMDLAVASGDIDEFAEKYYATMLDWSWPARHWNKERYFSGNTIELVPISMAILHFCGTDIEQNMIEAASFGRDCDTTASLVGSITAAMCGASAIRQDWIEIIEEANQDFFIEVEGDPQANIASVAHRMVDVIYNEQQAHQNYANLLADLLA